MSEAFDWNKLTIPQLKDHLKKRGLDQSGKKADLINRLIADDQAHQKEGQEKFELENVQEAKDVEQLDASEMNVSGFPMAEVDFTENITFEELEKNMTAKESLQQQAEEESDETETVREGGGGGGGGEEELVKEGQRVEREGDEKEKREGEGKEGGEGEAAILETSGGKETVDELPDVSSQFSIDIPKEKDYFRLTWNGKKFSVPFKMEISSDLAPSYRERSLLISPVEVADINTDIFRRLLERAQKFSIDFHDKSVGKTMTGQVKFLFKTPEEAEEVKAELKVFRESLTAEQIAFEFKESEEDFCPIVKKETSETQGSVLQRLLFVGNLPSDVTEATLSELFPDALRVILPHKEIERNAENVEETRHGYIEYSSEEEAAVAVETHKEKTLNDEKLFIIRAIAVRKERFGLLSDSLRQIFLDKIRKLQRILKNPYNKSQQDLNEIERTVLQTKEKLTLDTKHRLGWGMLLGQLDEIVLQRDNASEFSGNQRGRGGNQRGRGGRGQVRGGNFRGGQGMRRGGQMGGMTGMGGSQRGGYGYGASSSMGYGQGGGWNSGYGGGYQSYYSGGGTYQTQNYGGGYNQFSGKRRASYDNYTGEWKRGRGSFQQY